MTIFDHLLTLVLAIGLPLFAWYDAHRTRQRIRAGMAKHDPTTEYQWIMVIQWSLSVALLLTWWLQNRQMQLLGLNATAFTLVGLCGLAVALGWLALTVLQLRDTPALREYFASACADFDFILPRTRPQLRWFYATSITAGICEELLYRGFLFWYLEPLVGSIGAWLLSSLLFGLAHAYQGISNIFRTGLLGLVMGLVYLLTESLLAPMVLHAVVDILAGRAFFKVSAPRHAAA